MKSDTRNNYLNRIANGIRRITALIDACDPADGERLERYQEMFRTAMEVQNVIFDNDNTTFVSNKLVSFEGRLATLTGQEAASGAGEMEDVEIGQLVSAGDQSVEARVIRAIESAQQSLFDAYELLLECTPLAKAVPEIQIIQAKGKDLTGVMQNFHRLGKISHGE